MKTMIIGIIVKQAGNTPSQKKIITRAAHQPGPLAAAGRN
jgi:hypothetical protein